MKHGMNDAPGTVFYTKNVSNGLSRGRDEVKAIWREIVAANPDQLFLSEAFDANGDNHYVRVLQRLLQIHGYVTLAEPYVEQLPGSQQRADEHGYLAAGRLALGTQLGHLHYYGRGAAGFRFLDKETGRPVSAVGVHLNDLPPRRHAETNSFLDKSPLFVNGHPFVLMGDLNTSHGHGLAARAIRVAGGIARFCVDHDWIRLAEAGDKSVSLAQRLASLAIRGEAQVDGVAIGLLERHGLIDADREQRPTSHMPRLSGRASRVIRCIPFAARLLDAPLIQVDHLMATTAGVFRDVIVHPIEPDDDHAGLSGVFSLCTEPAASAPKE